jgi:hypothetical protein
MTEHIAGASPRLKARVAGVLYLLIFVAAPFAEFFVRGKLVILATPRPQRATSWRTNLYFGSVSPLSSSRSCAIPRWL